MQLNNTQMTVPAIWDLRNARFVAGDAKQLLDEDFAAMPEWPEFLHFWNDLEIDRYMNDGGMYRYRRFGRFKWFVDNDRLEQQHHTPYSQPRYFNPLNGGVERNFAPLTAQMASNAVLRKILLKLASIYADLEDVQSWKINTYFNRILARPSAKGLPVPEGRHRDGVKFSCLFMAGRTGIVGGVTTLVDIMHQQPIYTGALEQPCELVIFRDDTVFHDTTPIAVVEGVELGYRDVLVIEFY